MSRIKDLLEFEEVPAVGVVVMESAYELLTTDPQELALLRKKGELINEIVALHEKLGLSVEGYQPISALLEGRASTIPVTILEKLLHKLRKYEQQN